MADRLWLLVGSLKHLQYHPAYLTRALTGEVPTDGLYALGSIQNISLSDVNSMGSCPDPGEWVSGYHAITTVLPQGSAPTWRLGGLDGHALLA